MTPLPADIVELLDQAADAHGVDRYLARGVAWAESRGRVDAVSPKGAMGVMQLMPATAAGLGVDDPFDPRQNVDAGVRYIAKQIARFGGDVQSALAAYVWGPAHVEDHPSIADWPESVERYVRRVLVRADEERKAAGAGPRPSSSAPATPIPPRRRRSSRSAGRGLGFAVLLAAGAVCLTLLQQGRAWR